MKILLAITVFTFLLEIPDTQRLAILTTANLARDKANRVGLSERADAKDGYDVI
jgi:hypothetical protein